MESIKLKHNPTVEIATAPSRFARLWVNRRWTWEALVGRCSATARTPETVAEYAAMTHEQRSSAKDVGGFVGGRLEGGLRRRGNVALRSVATLDIDYGAPGVWERFTSLYTFGAMLYTTHSHTPERPRFRLVFPFSRALEPREYEPVCRRVAERIGIDLFDCTTFELPRLFYWPSTPSDGEFVFRCQDGPPCDADALLATYADPMDALSWPLGSREKPARTSGERMAADPTAKPGLIGAFCRAYTVEEAIDKYLSEVYVPASAEGRYTYAKGHVSGGLVCYEGKFAFSHHDTDPAGGRLCNAFDLVRIHLFGHLDGGKAEDDVTALPSYAEMQRLAGADTAVRLLMVQERQASAASDFESVGNAQSTKHNAQSTMHNSQSSESEGEGDEAWMERLDYGKKGDLRPSPKNLRIIALNDRNFRAVRFDLFSQRDVIADPRSPFAGTHGDDEVDDSSLSRMCAYLSEMYGIDMAINSFVDKVLKLTAPERSYHAVKEWLEREEWDGVPRIDTLLIDYLGAADTPLNRAVTRKWMAGAAGRAYDTDPDTGEGIKMDYCLVLNGPQGTGKSTFAEILAGRWRGSISLSEGKKEQCETLQRSWIVEIPELKGLKSAEMDAVKDLITSRSDNFRAAYARQWNRNPRHSVLIGSTNDEHFLKDTTGNRRFWVVRVNGGEGAASWRAKLQSETAQIWAEALHVYRSGEPLMLPRALEREMLDYAETFNEIAGDPLRDYLARWLEIRLPADWDSYEPARRMAYYRNADPLAPAGTVERTRVAIYEIITCCPWPRISAYSAKRIGAILRTLGWEKSERKLVDALDGRIGGKTKTTFFEKSQIESNDEI